MAGKKKTSTSMSRMLKILDTGIELEKKGILTYLRLALATKSLTGKNMFIRLAADEFDHMRKLEKIRAAKTGKKPLRLTPVPKKEIDEILRKLTRPDLLEKAEAGLEDLDALKLGVDMEARSVSLYRRLARSAGDRKIVELATDLARWEEYHQDLLSAEIDSIRNSGLYLDLSFL
jgi:rubrerythrin